MAGQSTAPEPGARGWGFMGSGAMLPFPGPGCCSRPHEASSRMWAVDSWCRDLAACRASMPALSRLCRSSAGPATLMKASMGSGRPDLASLCSRVEPEASRLFTPSWPHQPSSAAAEAAAAAMSDTCRVVWEAQQAGPRRQPGSLPGRMSASAQPSSLRCCGCCASATDMAACTSCINAGEGGPLSTPRLISSPRQQRPWTCTRRASRATGPWCSCC
mmetsp:Transcript_34731/g.77231  ORF Transcript_34731/g.77231 Transcript_34731/m.77231 type:complete len:217 (+) Transcript_34731:2996-3646(+)